MTILGSHVLEGEAWEKVTTGPPRYVDPHWLDDIMAVELVADSVGSPADRRQQAQKELKAKTLQGTE